MKNPMDRGLEKRLSDRAGAIGKEAEVGAFEELLALLQSPSANVRRLSASALGKLAVFGVDGPRAVSALVPIMLHDPHAQTRQYAIRALKAFGAASQSCQHDLRDIAANPHEKAYLQRDAASAITDIQEEIPRVADFALHRCQRCRKVVRADEYQRAQSAFQRTFCDPCFDEVYLQRRGFEMQVEINKTITARDGTVVQSKGELRIAEWLTQRGIVYRYDAKYRIIGEFQIRPDFYLPELDLYIEYWGLDTAKYKMSMYKKQTLYQQQGKRLIAVYPKDLSSLNALLRNKLALFGYHINER
jgi:hypothetical protein